MPHFSNLVAKCGNRPSANLPNEVFECFGSVLFEHHLTSYNSVTNLPTASQPSCEVTCVKICREILRAGHLHKVLRKQWAFGILYQRVDLIRQMLFSL